MSTSPLRPLGGSRRDLNRYRRCLHAGACCTSKGTQDVTQQQAEPTDQKETRKLACRLSQAEFNVKATEFAQLDDEREQLVADKKASAEAYKDRIGGVNARRAALRRVVINREEMRDVQCTWHADWAGKGMLLRRDDTGEVVEARTMTPDEVQTGFDYTGKDKQLPKKTDDSEPLDA